MIGGKEMVMCVICGKWKKAAIDMKPEVQEMLEKMGLDPNTFAPAK
jgi:ABC-type proline/glycine betaine transport system ATPase subunit